MSENGLILYWYLISRGFTFAISTDKNEKRGITFREPSVLDFILFKEKIQNGTNQ